jgi:hypothetical protein
VAPGEVVSLPLPDAWSTVNGSGFEVADGTALPVRSPLCNPARLADVWWWR